jgi:hypothetical protein
MILVGDASGVRAPYAVRSLLRAGPKWKFESITLREVGRQPNLNWTARKSVLHEYFGFNFEVYYEQKYFLRALNILDIARLGGARER